MKPYHETGVTHTGIRSIKIKTVLVLITAIFMQGPIACKSIPDETAPEAGPDKTLQDFYQAMNDGDLERAMTFIGGHIECRGHCYLNGKDSFRTFIQGNIDRNDQFEISDLRIAGDRVTFNYIIHRGDSILARGVDSVMQVQDGRIVYFEIH